MSQLSGKANCCPAFTCCRGLFPLGNWVPLSLPVSKPYNMVGVVYVLNYVHEGKQRIVLNTMLVYQKIRVRFWVVNFFSVDSEVL